MTIKDFVRKHYQILISIYVFANLAGWIVWRTYQSWQNGHLGYVEIGFAVQSGIMVTLILVRYKHKAIERRIFTQIIALIAFFSGLAMIGLPASGGESARSVSRAVTFCANMLGAACLLNLGRSFGILVALRKVKTGGLYRVIRHPMYAADILLRIGFLIGHFSSVALAIVVVSSACYVYRAVLEERFLKNDPHYSEYMEKVRFRFIPGIF